MRRTGYNQHNRPYLNNPVSAGLSPDFSVGYHLFNLNASLRISYRQINQSQQAFEVSQEFKRTSISLEFMKFFGDYYGFVPFFGVFTGPEILMAEEFDQRTQTFNIEEKKWGWGISAGWDIRPVSNQAIVMRTNIRYSPFLSLRPLDDHQILFDHLEVNFIQVVLYPQRLF